MTLTAAPLLGTGTALSIGTLGGSPTYTAIAKLNKITPPTIKAGTEDISTLDSGIWRQYIKTLLDGGELKITGLYASGDPGQQALQTAALASPNQTNGATYPFKLQLPVDGAAGQTTTGDVIAFSGIVTEFAPGEVQADKTIPLEVSIKVSGAVTFTEGS